MSYSVHAHLLPLDLTPWPSSSLMQGNKEGIHTTSETEPPSCWICPVPFFPASHQLCMKPQGSEEEQSHSGSMTAHDKKAIAMVFCPCKIKSPSNTEHGCFYETTCVFCNIFKEHSCWYLFGARVSGDSGQFDYYFFFSRLFTEAFSWGIFITAGWPFVCE